MELNMDWPIFRHVERQARRLSDMIERTGADPSRLVRLRHGEAYIEAHTKCIECRHATRCLSWLAAPKRVGECPDFCPNAALLESVKRGF
jgi:hypothetical protein